MFHGFPSRPSLKSAVLFFGLLLPAMGQDSDANPKEREREPRLRFICVSSLGKEQEVVLASRDDKGDWLEHGTVELRPAFITEWMPARDGKLHLALRDEGTLKSICQFDYPASARRALVVLIADPQRKIYRADVIDPEKMGFAKGSVLIINFTSKAGMVVLGSRKVQVSSGQRVVAKPALEDNGMYRMMVAYLDSDRKTVPCYDRYVPGSPDARDMIFLFPDPTLGLQVFSLPLFGESD